MDDPLLAIELRRDAVEVARARQAIRGACAGMGEDLIATAQLLASELVTNAIEHGAGAVAMNVRRSDAGHLRVEVADLSSRPPVRLTPDLEGGRGRGLMVVETYADSWGVEQRPPGKVVWFTLRGTSAA